MCVGANVCMYMCAVCMCEARCMGSDVEGHTSAYVSGGA
jgi:hypothetical protein